MEMVYPEEARTVEVKEEFASPKQKLEDIIREFDEKIRTNFSGSYTITITSPYLTTETISYNYKNGEDTNTFLRAPNLPTIEIHDTITVPKLTFTDLA